MLTAISAITMNEEMTAISNVTHSHETFDEAESLIINARQRQKLYNYFFYPRRQKCYIFYKRKDGVLHFNVF